MTEAEFSESNPSRPAPTSQATGSTPTAETETKEADSSNLIHDPNQTGTDQPVETIQQQTADSPELARIIEKRALSDRSNAKD
jgi:hypothetical protein